MKLSMSAVEARLRIDATTTDLVGLVFFAGAARAKDGCTVCFGFGLVGARLIGTRVFTNRFPATCFSGGWTLLGFAEGFRFVLTLVFLLLTRFCLDVRLD